MSQMRMKHVGLFVLAPWLFLVVCQPLIQPLYQGQLTNDQNGDEAPAAGLWWITEALSADDPKAKLAALSWDQPVDAAFEFFCDAVFGRLAARLGAIPKVVNIHELVRVYLI